MAVPVWESWDVEGAATHALVIGVSRYDHLPEKPGDPSPTDPRRPTYRLGQVRTPATGALRFAEWLREEYNMPNAPKASIRLLLSPSEFELEKVEGMADLGQNVVPATRENVEKALGAWRACCTDDDENVAILYAAGHGIELTKEEGGIVLLQDFAELPDSPLSHSLDVGRVRNGMDGHPMAQRQFYFVDACRVQPREIGDINTQGAGVALQSNKKGAAECTPIYFSAAPTTEAYGQEVTGTLFARALIECLERFGVDARDEDERWYCSTTGLIVALEERVRELSDELGLEQVVVPGGTPAHRPMHVLERPPEVSLEISVVPSDAAPFCLASLREFGCEPLWDDGRFDPVLVRDVPASAKYQLNVRIDPQNPAYSAVEGFPAPAVPPRPPPVRVPLETRSR